MSSDLFHKCLGHASFSALSNIKDIPTYFNKDNSLCDIFLHAKQARDKFHISNIHTNAPFDLIHCDIWGPYSEKSSCRLSYFYTLVDDYSRAFWVYLLARKIDVHIYIY